MSTNVLYGQKILDYKNIETLLKKYVFFIEIYFNLEINAFTQLPSQKSHLANYHNLKKISFYK